MIENRKYILGRNKAPSIHVKIGNQIKDSTSDKYVLILKLNEKVVNNIS